MAARTALLLVTVFLASAVAGCVTPDDADEGPDEPSETAATWTGQLHLGTDARLLVGDAATGTAPIGWSWQDWLDGRLAPRWESAPYTNTTLLQNIHVNITYEAAKPVMSTQTRPAFTIWLGYGHPGEAPGFIHHAFAAGPNTMTPGQQAEAHYPIRMPAGGLVLETGMTLQLHVGSYYPDNEDDPSMLVVMDASRIDFRHRTVELAPPTRSPHAATLSGELDGGRCVADVNPESLAHDRHTFHIDDQTTRLDLELRRLDGTGIGPDLDMFVEDANGDLVAYAQGSGTPEAIHLRAPNFAAAALGDWTLHVYNCHTQRSTYEVSLAGDLPIRTS